MCSLLRIIFLIDGESFALMSLAEELKGAKMTDLVEWFLKSSFWTVSRSYSVKSLPALVSKFLLSLRISLKVNSLKI